LQESIGVTLLSRFFPMIGKSGHGGFNLNTLFSLFPPTTAMV
jgi:hypothetical protein